MRVLFIVGVFLGLFAQPVLAADKVAETLAPVTQGSLTCFTISPPPDIPLAETCNSLCAEQGAACTGVSSHYSSIQSCEDNIGITQSSCRCCKGVGQ